jgi:hypothetical protein
MSRETNKCDVIAEAATIKAEYDDAYTMLASQQGILDIKRDIGTLLFSKVEELRSADTTCVAAKAGHLIAHNLSLQTQQIEREIQTVTHLVEDSATTVDGHLENARQHFLKNQAAYIEYAESMAPQAEVEAESADDALFSFYVA